MDVYATFAGGFCPILGGGFLTTGGGGVSNISTSSSFFYLIADDGFDYFNKISPASASVSLIGASFLTAVAFATVLGFSTVFFFAAAAASAAAAAAFFYDLSYFEGLTVAAASAIFVFFYAIIPSVYF